MFENKISQLHDMTDDQILEIFLGGLKRHIRIQIQDTTITDYSAAVQGGRKIEHLTIAVI